MRNHDKVRIVMEPPALFNILGGDSARLTGGEFSLDGHIRTISREPNEAFSRETVTISILRGPACIAAKNLGHMKSPARKFATIYVTAECI